MNKTSGLNNISGKVWLLGDNIDTDQMAPGHAMGFDWQDRIPHLFPKHRAMVDGAQQGDILVAGRNFGCGSSREQAVENLSRLGIACVIAESFARIFLRNAIANALPAIQCDGIFEICQQGDDLNVNWRGYVISNNSNGRQLSAKPYAPEMIAIIEQGGMLNLLKKQFQKAS